MRRPSIFILGFIFYHSDIYCGNVSTTPFCFIDCSFMLKCDAVVNGPRGGPYQNWTSPYEWPVYYKKQCLVLGFASHGRSGLSAIEKPFLAGDVASVGV